MRRHNGAGTEALLLSDDGHDDLMLAVPIPDGVDEGIREGLVRRRLLMSTGRCPCGAVLAKPNRAQRRAHRGQLLVVEVEHEEGCAAADVRLSRPASWRPR